MGIDYDKLERQELAKHKPKPQPTKKTKVSSGFWSLAPKPEKQSRSKPKKKDSWGSDTKEAANYIKRHPIIKKRKQGSHLSRNMRIKIL